MFELEQATTRRNFFSGERNDGTEERFFGKKRDGYR